MLVPLLVLVLGYAEARVKVVPLVNTDQGLIRGVESESGDYSMFLGIPYGKIRPENPFGVATPHPKFENIYEANDDTSICLQVTGAKKILGTLDCLRLNIYVPSKASSKNRLPVVVWIHGGSYNTGYSTRHHYGPKYFVQHDVIVVQISYRLGPYGFLCLGIPEVPGNQGIKDQELALKWVKDNIDSFGGDSDEITLMGVSAGASSVELHLLSKGQKLFNRAVLQSGTTYKPRGVHDTDVTPALQIAEILGLTTYDVNEALNFLIHVDPSLVMDAYSQLSYRIRACVEKEMENVKSIITEHPVNLRMPKINDMPILVGYTNREALMTDRNNPQDYFKYQNYFRDHLLQSFNRNIDEEFDKKLKLKLKLN